MAIDRNKVIAAAQKYIQKGAYKKAIKEYKKVVKEHPDDVRILLKIGDLEARDGQSASAARTYNEVADHYVAHGFFLKAVAAYKLLLGVQPTNVEAKGRLADLYFQLGLLRDALSNYQEVASVFSERGWVEQYLQTLQRIVDIDPDHPGNRIKLGEELARFEQTESAAEHFRLAAAQLKKQGRFEEFTRVMERYVHLVPDDAIRVHDLARTYLQQNRPKRALVRIQPLLKADPRNPETVDILVRALDQLGEKSRAVAVLEELATAFEGDGAMDARDEIYRKLVEIEPSHAAAREALGLNEAPIVTFEVVEPDAPSAPIAPEPIAGVPAPQGDPDEIAKLLAETDVYLKYNLYDKALDHLNKVFALDPENLEGLERKKSSLIASGQEEVAIGVLIGMARIAHRSDQVQSMLYLNQALAIRPDHPDVVEVMAELGGLQGLEPVAPSTEAVVTAGASGASSAAPPSAESAPEPTGPRAPIAPPPPPEPPSEVTTVAEPAAAPEAVTSEAPAPPVDGVVGAGDGGFAQLDALFDSFEIEDTAAGHRTLSETFVQQVAPEEEEEDVALIDLGAQDILPEGLDAGLERVDALLAAEEVDDARAALFELLGAWPEHAEMLLRRMDELPAEVVPEPVAEPEAEDADDMFFVDDEDDEGDAPMFVEDGDVSDAPMFVEDGDVSDAPVFVEDVEEAPITFEPASASMSGQVAAVAETAADEDGFDEDEGEPILFDPMSSSMSVSMSGQVAAVDAGDVSTGDVPSDEALSDEALSDAGPLSGDAAADEAASAPAPLADSGGPGVGLARVALVSAPASVARGNAAAEPAPDAADAGDAAPATPPPTGADNLTPRAEVSTASELVAAALEGDGLDVDEDAIRAAEAHQERISGGFAVAAPSGEAAPVAASTPPPARRAVPPLPSVMPVDAPTSVEADGAATEAVEEDTEAAPLAVAAPAADVETPDGGEHAFEGNNLETEQIQPPSYTLETEELPASPRPNGVDSRSRAADAIVIAESDIDDDISIEEFEEASDDADFEVVEADEFERAEVAVDVDAPVGRASSAVARTFGPADAVLSAAPDSGLAQAIRLRRDGQGMAAMFDLQSAEGGADGAAAGFELALANIEMGLYFEGITALEELLAGELSDDDRVLVHYHLGIAYEAMDQADLAAQNFRTVRASTPDAFPDVGLRLQRMESATGA